MYLPILEFDHCTLGFCLQLLSISNLYNCLCYCYEILHLDFRGHFTLYKFCSVDCTASQQFIKNDVNLRKHLAMDCNKQACLNPCSYMQLYQIINNDQLSTIICKQNLKLNRKSLTYILSMCTMFRLRIQTRP